MNEIYTQSVKLIEYEKKLTGHFFTCFSEFNVTSSYSPQLLSVAENEIIKFQGNGSCESPKRDK